MIFKNKSHRPPLCRSCGKPIRKSTTIVYVKDNKTEYDRPDNRCRYVYGTLKTKADCQRHSNQQVVSVKYTVDYENYDTPKPETRRVHAFHEWDGESYDDEFFCSGECAKQFGRMAAKSGKVASVAYNDALRAQRGEKVK